MASDSFSGSIGKLLLLEKVLFIILATQKLQDALSQGAVCIFGFVCVVCYLCVCVCACARCAFVNTCNKNI